MGIFNIRNRFFNHPNVHSTSLRTASRCFDQHFSSSSDVTFMGGIRQRQWWYPLSVISHNDRWVVVVPSLFIISYSYSRNRCSCFTWWTNPWNRQTVLLVLSFHVPQKLPAMARIWIFISHQLGAILELYHRLFSRRYTCIETLWRELGSHAELFWNSGFIIQKLSIFQQQEPFLCRRVIPPSPHPRLIRMSRIAPVPTYFLPLFARKELLAALRHCRKCIDKKAILHRRWAPLMLQFQGLRLPPKIRHDNGLTVETMGRKGQLVVPPSSILRIKNFVRGHQF